MRAVPVIGGRATPNLMDSEELAPLRTSTNKSVITHDKLNKEPNEAIYCAYRFPLLSTLNGDG